MIWLTYNLNSGLQTDLLYVNFKKAFDKVPHYCLRMLQIKLFHYDIRGTTLNWIKDLLAIANNRSQQVIINEYSSSLSQVTSGIPQGSVLRPLIFICYINDLPKKVKLAVS